MPESFLLVTAFMLVAYLAPVVLVAGLVFLRMPRLRQTGARILRGGGAGAVGGALASLVIGVFQHHGANGRGVLAAAGFGFTAAGLAMAVLHARQRARPAQSA